MKKWLGLIVMYGLGVPVGVATGYGLFFIIEKLIQWMNPDSSWGFLWVLLLAFLWALSFVMGYFIQSTILFAANIMKCYYNKMAVFISGLLSYFIFFACYLKSPLKDVLGIGSYTGMFIFFTFFCSLVFIPATSDKY